ncbi:MAG: hypothetical protein R2860_01660 [Desulfobacterales bacterium]
MLWLNHLARILRLRDIPVKDTLQFSYRSVLDDITQKLLNSNIGDQLYSLPGKPSALTKVFTKMYVSKVLESVPLGLGFSGF